MFPLSFHSPVVPQPTIDRKTNAGVPSSCDTQLFPKNSRSSGQPPIAAVLVRLGDPFQRMSTISSGFVSLRSTKNTSVVTVLFAESIVAANTVPAASRATSVPVVPPMNFRLLISCTSWKRSSRSFPEFARRSTNGAESPLIGVYLGASSYSISPIRSATDEMNEARSPEKSSMPFDAA